MKLKTASGVGIESNTQGSEAMDFGIGDASVIIEILRNRLYSNPIQTLVQEYISNGRDASREAKNKIPLKITLPTKLDSVFKVRDFGIGISPKLMKEVFVLYGKSTKRGSDTQTGGFGIGAKSAWAYTDSFTIVSYVDGVARSYLAHIGKNSNGSLEQLSEEPTTEPNGTEIQIGVNEKDRRSFILASYRATMFWDVKPIFEGITEAEIPSFYKKMNCVMTRDNWSIYKSGELNSFMDGTHNYGGYNYNSQGGVVAVVDGIPYKLSSKFLELSNIKKCLSYLNNSMVLAIHVGNGDVEVSASREAIADSEFSQKSINEIAEKVFKSIEKQVKEELNKAKDFKSYLKAHYQLNETLNERLATEKVIGKTKYEIDGRYCLKSTLFDHVSIDRYSLNAQRNRTVVSSEKVKSLYISKDTIFMYQDIEEGATKTRERIRNYFGGDTSKQVYLIQATVAGSKEQFRQLIEEIEASPISEYALPEVVKEKTQRVSNKGKLCLHYLSCETGRSRYYPTVGRESTHLEFDEIDTDTTTLYVEMVNGSLPEDINNADFPHMIKFLNSKDYQVVGVSSQVKSKITELENFVDYKTFVKKITEEIPLSQEEINSLKKKTWKGAGDFRKLAKFTKELKDKNIKEILEMDDQIQRLQVVELSEKVTKLYSKKIQEISSEMEEKNKLISKLAKKYPLVSAVSYYSGYGEDDRKNNVLKELVEYINLKAQAE